MNADVTVRDVMSPEFVGVSESDDVRATAELMLEEQAECAVVLRGTTPVGLLTEREVLRLVADDRSPSETEVGAVMREAGPAVGPDEGLDAALDVMATEDVRWVVVGGQDLVGVLTEHDLLSAAALDRYEEPETLQSVAVNGADEYATPATHDAAVSEQSICQECGALARDLVSVDGQLLCPDCSDV